MSKAGSIDELLLALTEGMEDHEILAASITSDISNEIAKRRMSLNLSQNGDMNFTMELLAEIACKLNMKLLVEMKPQEVVQKSGRFKGISSGNVVDFKAIRSYSEDFQYLTVIK